MQYNYFLLFIDNLISALILPIHQAYVFKTMLYFQQYYNISLMLFVGVLGSCLGGVLNLYIGRIIILLRHLYHKSHDNLYNNTRRDLLVCAVILFAWAPALGSSVQVLSGYFKINLNLSIYSTILSNFFYLLYLVIAT